MSKIAVIENCFVCSEKKIYEGKDYCAKETNPCHLDFADFEDLTGRLLERYKSTGKWCDIPEWCQLEDKPEPSGNSYTLKKLRKMAISVTKSREFKQFYGPNKDRGHACIMGVVMFLTHIKNQEEA